MTLYTEESLQLLKEKVDLIQIIQPYMPMAAVAYPCPFCDHAKLKLCLVCTHKDYICYECDARGDAITFLMTYNKMGFTEAITHLANYYGVKLEKCEVKDHVIRTHLNELKNLRNRVNQMIEKYE